MPLFVVSYCKFRTKGAIQAIVLKYRDEKPISMQSPKLLRIVPSYILNQQPFYVFEAINENTCSM